MGFSLATATLFAATIAWKAVQRQIANQRIIASRNEDDAFTAIKDGAAELYGMLNLIWRAIDVTLSNKWPQNLEANISLVRSLRDTLPTDKSSDVILDIAEQLGPSKRRKLLLFLNMIRSFFQRYRQFDKQDNQFSDDGAEVLKYRMHELRMLRILLTHSYKYLEAFDYESATIFADRKKSAVDHRQMHEHLESTVSSAERGENWAN